MIRLEITPFARSQVKDVAHYYVKHASPAVAARFRDACRFLTEHPGAGSLRFACLLTGIALRTWSLQRFPFRLFYVLDGSVLRILAVDHARRDVTPSLLERAKRGA
ncbi:MULTISPECIES: type II toxin-antitoxin system RelE/ParE family toxin [unclassified Undibacterium]|uniref:type II toxin-antitoxin system RelE/ParE family toxin n=1 Tax=unclassified Undibacterium TaxID=2630295 RepID=UPI002AC9A3B6|nr:MULTISPECIES: type II toxin-antitoxin system RelE/ParE family toxin [unclassified Undibacterium]MEB0140298.1 type II toxin-antitoxin system RelE/ParE family toxin [Undibacterium sp. CCC2.1]MEB0173579.1 type II toxin-antitoxin system RelE/ParE family toxin [Undibacterium sp. CCC1.1]MEB0177206.1 type II toxin-antitoxin system RelE/ParE family toxin [Undibacterium sp. CCC3.4]MEB0216471.1 type II toxin-antitoxin system RelE/ParE family toxin [Undibacterium sp. 5I2]WPX43241.1 type II toxin-antit